MYLTAPMYVTCNYFPDRLANPFVMDLSLYNKAFFDHAKYFFSSQLIVLFVETTKLTVLYNLTLIYT